MIRKVTGPGALHLLLNGENESPEERGKRRVQTAFQSIFDTELEKVGLTMDDVNRLNAE